MTDYAADLVTEAGTPAANLRTGTASADTLPAGATVLFNNTGAGSHNLDLTINFQWHGLSPGSAATPSKRRIAIAAGAWIPVLIPNEYGDANGRVALAIDATATEVKYLILAT